MWNWIACYVSGHDYSVSCQDGAMFLRCVLCGRRSQGWTRAPRRASRALTVGLEKLTESPRHADNTVWLPATRRTARVTIARARIVSG